VLDPRRRPRLHQEPLARSGVRVGAEELDRDRSGQHRVLGQVDLPGRALAEPAQHHEIVELLGRLERRHPAHTGRSEILSGARHGLMYVSAGT
jgi:hypothetical protein